MKLLFAIVQNDDAKSLTRKLIEHNISVTRISSSGGFLSNGNQTLMIGVEKDRLQDTLDIIKAESHRRKATLPAMLPHAGHVIDGVSLPLTITIGGATVFVVDVDDCYKF